MKKLTAEWVRKAEADLLLAVRVSAQKPRLNDAICFHCQQAAEKYLKALLCERTLSIPRTHDLGNLLLQLLPTDSGLAKHRRRFARLTEFAVDYRYPGIHASTRQAQSAIRTTTLVRDDLRSCLGLPPRPIRAENQP